MPFPDGEGEGEGEGEGGRVGAGAVAIRPAGAEDLPFLRDMLVQAAWWRGDEAPPDTDTALRRPDLALLLDGWGRPGDVGWVAWHGPQRLGAAWYRAWTRERHSYGFVDEATPEVAIGVLPEARGRGVGTALLSRLVATARANGVPQLSLSVERDNPAARLYTRLGFRQHAVVGGAWTMVLRLAS